MSYCLRLECSSTYFSRKGSFHAKGTAALRHTTLVCAGDDDDDDDDDVVGSWFSLPGSPVALFCTRAHAGERPISFTEIPDGYTINARQRS